MEQKETKDKYPFEIELDERIDADSITFRIEFKKKLPNKEDFETAIKKWAEKGIEEGYGEGKLQYLDDEPDELGESGFEWNEEEKWVEFFVDWGSAGDEPLDALFEELLNFKVVGKVKMGSGYGNW